MSESQSHTDELSSGIKRVLNNPALAQAVLDQTISTRPKGWSRRSNAPYYREQYAIQLRRELDAMMLDREDRLYSLEQFPTYALETIYLRLNQSLRYILDKMDSEKKYCQFSQMFVIQRKKGVGVVLKMIEDLRNGDISEQFVPTKLADATAKETMQDRIDRFLENAKIGDEFYQHGLCLGEQQIRDIKLSLQGVEGFIFNVRSTEVKIVRLA